MPKRDPKRDPWETADAASQARHRPDQPTSSSTPEAPGRAEGERKREHQEQINVLVPSGMRTPFRIKAMTEGTTMSDLVTAWIREYLDGKR